MGCGSPTLASRYWESSEHALFLELKYQCEQVPSMKQLQVYRMLGRGAYGDVFAVRILTTGRLLALKCMSKRVIKGKNDSRAAMRERQHLQMVASTQSPFVVSLAYAFVDHDNVYVAMDLCAGGDLKYGASREGDP